MPKRSSLEFENRTKKSCPKDDHSNTGQSGIRRGTVSHDLNLRFSLYILNCRDLRRIETNNHAFTYRPRLTDSLDVVRSLRDKEYVQC
jgi:hypothetical protein